MPTNLIEKARRLVELDDEARQHDDVEAWEGFDEFHRCAFVDGPKAAKHLLRAVELLRGIESSWHPDCDDDACEVRAFLRDIGAEE